MGKIRFLLPMISLILVGCILGGVAPSGPVSETPASSGADICGGRVCSASESAESCAPDCATPTSEQATRNAPEAGSLSSGPRENSYWMINPTSGAKLFVVVTYPPDGGGSLVPAVIMIPGGLGTKDIANGTDIDAVRLSAAGYAVIQFDADGRGSSAGEEDYNGFIHQDGLAALILAAGQIPRVDSSKLGVISRSYGVTMAAGALGRYPSLPVRFYIDWEGPADRNYTTTGCSVSHSGINWPSCEDSTFWSEREAVEFIGGVRVPYLRIQSATDHVQRENSHAVVMINAAVQGGVPWVRLNDGPVMAMYDPDNPPAMLPDTIDRQLADLFVRYAEELFALNG